MNLINKMNLKTLQILNEFNAFYELMNLKLFSFLMNLRNVQILKEFTKL